MKILHTADWHIGQTLTGYGREHEHRAVLDELVAIVSQREVDALVVAGDVFDHQNPSGEAQRLFYETLVALKQARPAMTVVVTAGNHDAAGRLEAPRALLNAMDVHIVGNVRRVDGRIDAARHLVPLRSAGGEIAAHVLAVSYPTPACLPPFSRLDLAEGHSPIVAATAALYSELHERSGRAGRGCPSWSPVICMSRVVSNRKARSGGFWSAARMRCPTRSFRPTRSMSRSATCIARRRSESRRFATADPCCRCRHRSLAMPTA